MAAGDYIIPGAQAVTQWGIGFINACGEAALAVLEGIQNGVAPTISTVQNLARAGTSFGTDPTGTSTLQELQKLAASMGTATTIGPGGQAGLNTINANLAQGKPTEVNIQKASALGGNDVGVAGHYVTVVGRAANGNYIVADSNQAAARSGQFVQYSPQQLLNADLYGTLTATGVPNPGAAVGGFTADAISQGITTGFQNVLNGLFGGIKVNLGITGLSDFAWRSALIVGGMVLIVIGLLVFFSKQEGDAITVVTQQAGTAAKAAAAAAA